MLKQNIMSTSIEIITPAKARDMLVHNTDNRRVRKSAVKDFARQMKEKIWKTTHQGIAIAPSGRVLDGQHRLLAIIESGVTVRMQVSRGADEKTFDSIDLGCAPRDSSDRLGVDKRVGGVFSAAIRICSDRWGRPSSTELHEMQALIGEETEALIAAHGAAAPYFSAAPVKLAAVCNIIQSGDRDYVHDLYGNLVYGKLEKLPLMASVWFSQWSLQKINTKDESHTLSYACAAFEKKNANKSRFPIKRDDYGSFGHDFVRKVLDDKAGVQNPR